MPVDRPVSSSRMTASPKEAATTPAGTSKASANPSSNSSLLSPRTGTAIVASVWPERKFSLSVVAT